MSMILESYFSLRRGHKIWPCFKLAIGYHFFPCFTANLYIYGFNAIKIKSEVSVILNNTRTGFESPTGFGFDKAAMPDKSYNKPAR